MTGYRNRDHQAVAEELACSTNAPSRLLLVDVVDWGVFACWLFRRGGEATVGDESAMITKLCLRK